jgi:hypothetical protein
MINLILLLISTSVTQHVECIAEDVLTIKGTVMDQAKDPLLFCNIYAYDKENKLLKDTVTNLDGLLSVWLPGWKF